MLKHTVSLRVISWTEKGECVDTTRYFVNKSAAVATAQAKAAVAKLHRDVDVHAGVQLWWLEHSLNGKVLWFHGRTWYAVHCFNVSDPLRKWSDDLAYWYPMQEIKRERSELLNW